MSRAADVLQEFFVGRADAYALQQSDGSYVAVRKPLVPDLLEKHVLGDLTLGVYLVTPEGKTCCGVYDFDEKTETVCYILDWLGRWFDHWRIVLLREESGQKGYHGWILFKGLVPASKVIRLLRIPLHEIERDEGVSCQVEVFPKQATTQDLGNLIKLPWGIHRRSGRRTSFLGEDFNELPDLGVGIIDGLPVIDEEKIDEVLSQYSEEEEPPSVPGQTPGTKAALPCFTRMLEGVQEGFRHIASFRLAVMLYRQGMDQQLALATLLTWDGERNQPPLGQKHIQRNLKDAYSGRYRLGCPDIEGAGYCSEVCPLHRRRQEERDRKVASAPSGTVGINRVVKHSSNPPAYQVEVDGRVLWLKHEQLFSLREFQKLYHQSFDLIPNVGMKQKDWFDYVNGLQVRMEIQDAPKDAADGSRYIDLLWEWLRTSSPARSAPDVEAGRPVLRDDRFYFRARDAQEYLRRRFHLNIERSDLWALLRQHGADRRAVTMRVGERTFKFWCLPVSEETGQPHEGPDE